MNRTIKVAATLTVAGVLALTGCGGDSDASDGGGTTLNHWYHDPITGECRELKYQGYGMLIIR